MIGYISSWARQVILAVLIAIILEMILLKESKTTKYIKIVIGVYVMYVIIAPALNFLNGSKIDFSKINYEDYFTNSNTYKEMKKSIDSTEENLNIRETYELKLKQDIENKLREKGYEVSNIKLSLDLNLSSEEYGAIKLMEIKLSKRNDEVKNTNTIYIDKVNVNISNESKQESIKDDEEIRKFLSEEYGVNLDKIVLK